jgi:hypothetical protein
MDIDISLIKKPKKKSDGKKRKYNKKNRDKLLTNELSQQLDDSIFNDNSNYDKVKKAIKPEKPKNDKSINISVTKLDYQKKHSKNNEKDPILDKPSINNKNPVKICTSTKTHKNRVILEKNHINEKIKYYTDASKGYADFLDLALKKGIIKKNFTKKKCSIPKVNEYLIDYYKKNVASLQFDEEQNIGKKKIITPSSNTKLTLYIEKINKERMENLLKKKLIEERKKNLKLIENNLLSEKELILQEKHVQKQKIYNINLKEEMDKKYKELKNIQGKKDISDKGIDNKNKNKNNVLDDVSHREIQSKNEITDNDNSSKVLETSKNEKKEKDISNNVLETSKNEKKEKDISNNVLETSKNEKKEKDILSNVLETDKLTINSNISEDNKKITDNDKSSKVLENYQKEEKKSDKDIKKKKISFLEPKQKTKKNIKNIKKKKKIGISIKNKNEIKKQEIDKKDLINKILKLDITEIKKFLIDSKLISKKSKAPEPILKDIYINFLLSNLEIIDE